MRGAGSGALGPVGRLGTMTMASDRELAERILAGDPEAESAFVARFERPLRYWLLRHERLGEAELEDLLQDTLLTTLMRLREGGLKDPDRLGAFVYNTAKNLRISAQRKARRQQTLLGTYGDPRGSGEVAGPDELAERRALAGIVRQVIDEMPVERDRQILLLHYLHGLDKKQVCILLDLDERHFDRVIARARKRFRALWQARG